MLRVLGWGENIGGRMRVQIIADKLLRPMMLVGLMFLLMRAELFGHCAPFGAALMAAGLAAGESAAALVLGCLLGMLRLPLNQLPILPGVCCAAVLAGELVFSTVPALKKAAPETRVCAVAGFAVLIPALIAAGGRVLPSLQALACAAIAATSAPFMLPALGIKMTRKRLMMQERVGALLFFGACIAGLRQFYPPVAQVFSNFALLAAPGAGTGVLCALALVLGGGLMTEMLPLAVCGLVTGWKYFTARWHRSLALMISAGIFQLASRGSPLDMLWPALACIFYMILPEPALAAVHLVTAPEDPACEPDRIAREVTAESRQRLRALGDAFGEMSEGCTAPTDVPGEQELIYEMRSRLCTDCPGYGECWAGSENRAVRFLCQLITEALDRMDAPPGMRVLFSDGEIPPEVLRICRRGRMIPDRLGLLLRDFAEKRRAEIKRCATGQLLAVQLMQAREILYDLAEKQAAPVSFHGPRLEQLHAALDCAGISDCEAAAIGIGQAQIRLTRPQPWSREEVGRASAAFSKAFGGGFTPELRGESLIFSQHTRLKAETGVSCQSGVAGEACGDSHLIRMLGQSKLVVMLSDGMGSGSAASNESSETLRLLWRFLCAGISRPLALESVNQQMLMRSGEELFATVDLCIIDLHTGMAEFTKLAASRSIVLRGSQLQSVEGGRLPLGILERVQPEVTRIRLRPGDTVILGSDGVMEADGMAIERSARLNSGSEPETMARELVREAGIRRSRGRSDDMTCICVKISPARPA